MSSVIRTQLFPGVHLTGVYTGKFKSNYIGVALLTGLDGDRAAGNALLPWVLRRGSRNYPDMQAVSTRLDQLYGGSVDPVVLKKGETQCLCFAGSFLDDAYALDGEQLLEPALELMSDLLLHPRTQDGVFCREYVESERANLIDRIRGQMNDKRLYSMTRLAQEMCRDEAYGIGKYGDEASAAALDAGSLWQHYQNLIGSAQVELFYCGSAQQERVEQAFRTAFGELPVNPDREQPGCEVRLCPKAEPAFVEEELDVTQGKLAMGFRTDGVTIRQEEYPALILLNAVFGGTSMSKLFMNVREKLSLCYFASSIVEKQKGLMLVSSGIEFDKFQQARDEILAQLDACRRGDITAGELEGARRILITALHTMLDGQSRMWEYWLGMAASGLEETPQQFAQRLEQVTPAQVVSMANRIRLDTVYFLKGKEAAR